MAIFYTPDRAWLGDVIPYQENGKFYIFYLNDKRYMDRIGQETTWDLLTTTDFVHFKNEGTAIPIGTQKDFDNAIYTGSVIKGKDGYYHIFYTAQNNFNDTYRNASGAVQVVTHATSRDLIHWEKHPDHRFESDGVDYTQNDWRDPFVFLDEDRDQYVMLLAAVKQNGRYKRCGCTLMAVSDDLVNWKVDRPLYAPDEFLTHECPDLFEMNGKWYLMFSTFTEKFLTHYRISDNMYGPWHAPLQDSLDARAWYAAKTAELNGTRYAFGWIPTKHRSCDFNEYEWGGTLVVHQLVQKEDGTLQAKIPDSLYASFEKPVVPQMCDADGNVVETDGEISIDAALQPGYAVFASHPAECMLECEIEYSEDIRWFGVALHQSDNLDDGYFYRIEPFHRRVVMDMWPRRELTRDQVHLGGDIPFQSELERGIVLDDNCRVTIKMLIDRDCVVMYVNDEVAMSTRIYNLLTNPKWGFFAVDGKIAVRNVTIKTQNKN